MRDPWLRGQGGAWLPSPQNQGVFNLVVSDLMLPNVNLWDKEKIESLFPSHIANRIVETPLLNMVEVDKLIWADSVDGVYNVKSGYKLLMNIAGKAEALVPNVAWHRLWKIHAPPKAKHLLWRICRGCLPTRLRLQEKYVSCPLSCPLCDQGQEDDWHVFLTCNISLQAIQATGLEHLLLHRIQPATNLKELIFDVCSGESKEAAGLFAMLLWVLWQNRNNKIWNDEQETGRNLGFKTRFLWQKWYEVQQFQHGTQHPAQQQQSITWAKPSQGWFKCNLDAGFHRDLNKTSAGWCLRDHMGRFVMAETTWLNGNYSVIEGEAIAMLEALKAMEQRRISHVIFETDCKSVVDAIQHFRGGNSDFSLLVSHIKNLLDSNNNFVVKFIKRQANMVAHSLARAAISWSSRCSFETLPTCISELLINEMI
jgi:ribonuclease HI